MLRTFASQCTYGPYGHLICTPASCAVGVSFLAHGLSGLVTGDRVDRIMQKSHRLLASLSQKRMLMLSEIQDLIPVPFEEVAGLTTSMPHSVPLTEKGLVLCSLTALLLYCQGTQRRCAVVVTLREHTTCYLVESDGRMYHFDPLPATLRQVTGCLSLPTAAEYSGLLLYKRTGLRSLKTTQ